MISIVVGRPSEVMATVLGWSIEDGGITNLTVFPESDNSNRSLGITILLLSTIGLQNIPHT